MDATRGVKALGSLHYLPEMLDRLNRLEKEKEKEKGEE